MRPVLLIAFCIGASVHATRLFKQSWQRMAGDPLQRLSGDPWQHRERPKQQTGFHAIDPEKLEEDNFGHLKIPASVKDQIPSGDSKLAKGSKIRKGKANIASSYESLARRWPDIDWTPRQYPDSNRMYYERLFSSYNTTTQTMWFLRVYTQDHHYGAPLWVVGGWEEGIGSTKNGHVKEFIPDPKKTLLTKIFQLPKNNVHYHGILNKYDAHKFREIARDVVEKQIETQAVTLTRDIVKPMLARLRFIPEVHGPRSDHLGKDDNDSDQKSPKSTKSDKHDSAKKGDDDKKDEADSEDKSGSKDTPKKAAKEEKKEEESLI